MSLKDRGKGIVLVGVLKRKRDLEILLREHWYRIPVTHAPTRKFEYLAFYQPALFGRQGTRIQYYARIVRIARRRRIDLLPDEQKHPNAEAEYLRISVGRIARLPRPIKNTAPRRISFAFTTLARLRSARNILKLFNVAPTEEIVGRALQRSGIRAMPQYMVSVGTPDARKRYRLDFAVLCNKGAIAIECDNKKAHAGRLQRERDNAKDKFLRGRGWTVIRLTEEEILLQLPDHVGSIRHMVQKLGGVT